MGVGDAAGAPAELGPSVGPPASRTERALRLGGAASATRTDRRERGASTTLIGAADTGGRVGTDATAPTTGSPAIFA